MKLNELSDVEGARKPRMRVGRGIGSGKGKTAGRGVKGQKARSGVSGIRQFEGGQMPLYMRLPKRGFKKPNRARYVEVNIGRLQAFIDAGKIDVSKKIDAAALVASGLVRRVNDGVRLLGVGELTSKFNIEVAHATAGARAAVERAGGSVEVLNAPSADAAEKPVKGKKKPAK